MRDVEGLNLRVYHGPRVAYEVNDEKSGGITVGAAHPGVGADSLHDYSPSDVEGVERDARRDKSV